MFDNDNMADGDFTWNDKNAVTSDTYKTPKSRYYLKWSNEYKEACRIIYDKSSKPEDFKKAEQILISESEKGNLLAIHDLGKLYSTDKLGEKDDEKSYQYYEEALQGFIEIEPISDKLKPYLQYRIGKMYCYGLGTEQDYEKAFVWFLKSAQELSLIHI